MLSSVTEINRRPLKNSKSLNRFSPTAPATHPCLSAKRSVTPVCCSMVAKTLVNGVSSPCYVLPVLEADPAAAGQDERVILLLCVVLAAAVDNGVIEQASLSGITGVLRMRCRKVANWLARNGPISPTAQCRPRDSSDTGRRCLPGAGSCGTCRRAWWRRPRWRSDRWPRGWNP